MNMLMFLIFVGVIKGVTCGQCFQCDSMNYAACTVISCASEKCQTRKAMNQMVSYMCAASGDPTGCRNDFGAKVCTCSGDRCNNEGIPSNNSTSNNGNTGSADWGIWGNNNGMGGNPGNTGNGAGWGNGNSMGGDGIAGGNWKDWGSNQAQGWGNGNSYNGQNNCRGNGNRTAECQGNENSGQHTYMNTLLVCLWALLAFVSN